MIREGIEAVVARRHLTEAEAIGVMTEIMEGNATPAQIAAFIMGLRMKGETVEEITGCARVMRDKATFIHTPAGSVPVDTAGTGGDGAHTFNISTTAAFVAAGAGVVMAKHGNRAASSQCGSADLLEALGIDITVAPAGVEAAIQEVGIGFLFAPALHGAMRHAVGPRREIGVRTIFNILGPLTNPARSQHQLVGIYDAALTSMMATVLHNLGGSGLLSCTAAMAWTKSPRLVRPPSPSYGTAKYRPIRCSRRILGCRATALRPYGVAMRHSMPS